MQIRSVLYTARRTEVAVFYYHGLKNMDQGRDAKLILGIVFLVLVAAGVAYLLVQQTPFSRSGGEDAGLKEGLYSLRGTPFGANSSPYIGSVSIVKAGETYALWWQIANQVQQGIGILRDDILSVSYIDVTDPAQISDVGVVSYRILPGDALEGTWSSLYGGGVVGTERLVWEGALGASMPQQTGDVVGDEQSSYGDAYASQFASETFDADKDRVNSHVWITANADALLLQYEQDDLVNFNVETGALRVAVDSGLFERGPYAKSEDWSVVATARLDGSGVLLNYAYPDDSVEAIFIRTKSANSMSVLVREIQEKARKY